MILTKRYDRARALEYAKRWANGRNPLFYNFTGEGGDCTNFVSQCVLAGALTMNFTKDLGWYYRSAEDRAPAWTGVEYFWDFMTGAPAFRRENGGIGPFGSPVARCGLAVGDAVQLGDENGDYYHTLLVTGFREGDVLLAAHSRDVFDRPLSSYDYSVVRFLHVEGVRVSLDCPDAFAGLIDGTSLPIS